MIDQQTLRALAYFVARCRPTYAPHAAWDEAGIMAALSRVANMSPGEVGLAAIRAAMDKTAKTPGVISSLDSIHWREKPTAAHERGNHPPTSTDACRIHGGHRDNCSGCAADAKAAIAEQQTRTTRTDDRATPEQVTRHLAAFRAAQTKEDT